MAVPVIKEVGNSEGTRWWKFKINGHYYGLTINPAGVIMHYEESKMFYVQVRNKQLVTGVFREAFNFLNEHAVKPFFKN